MTQLQKRVVTWYEEVKQKHQGETVVVVTHGAVINALSLHIMKKELTIQKVQEKCNEFIRLRDKDKPCISCGVYKKIRVKP